MQQKPPAGTARVLRANMAMNEETSRLDIELLADVLANFNQILTALTAEMTCPCGVRCAADVRAGAGGRHGGPVHRVQEARCWRIGQALGHLSLGGRQITGQSFLETGRAAQRTGSHCVHRSAFGAVGQLKGKGLDFGVGGVQFGVAVSDLRRQSDGFARVFLRLIQQILNRARNPPPRARDQVSKGPVQR